MIAQHVSCVIIARAVLVVHHSLKSVCHAAVHQIKLEAKEEIVSNQVHLARATNPDTTHHFLSLVSSQVVG